MQTKTKMISKNQIKYIRQLEQKKFRKREKCFVAEGPKVVGDLMQQYQPKAIFATDEWIKEVESCDYSKLTTVSPDELRRISFLQTPQQVLALFPIPEQTSYLSPHTCSRQCAGSWQSRHHHPHCRLVWHRHHLLQ